MPGRAHGLREAGATFTAENGANEMQLAAMFGWQSTRMAEVYTRRANPSLLAEQAANALSPHLENRKGIKPEKSIKSIPEK